MRRFTQVCTALALSSAVFSPSSLLAQATDEELAKMTDQVVQQLQLATPGQDKAAAKGREDNLYQQLTEIVGTALKSGKSQEDVAALIEEALSENANPELLARFRDGSGKINASMLISEIVARSGDTQVAEKDAAYVGSLRAEVDKAPAAKPADGEKDATSGKGEYVVVGPGDTLSKYAKRFYGDADGYMRIYRANQDKLKSPDTVNLGTRLFIPL
ncbi:MAG: LysM peptidoglycan-binding domain-containing protein [Notoacmeibacter sp.]|nr:LysM peptidoglycan-binding domain-containing protein [Notoacmeibacter sp.]